MSPYLKSVVSDPYYKNLLLLRDSVSLSCDDFFREKKAIKVDLYLITNSISSPVGKGSDSKPLPIKFGNKKAMLADSSQFGMELLVQKHFDAVYCYLPSFRGEEPDNEHLNQFFHCEAEIRGDLDRVLELSEGLVKRIVTGILDDLENKMFYFDHLSTYHLKEYTKTANLPQISFNEGFKLLVKQKDYKTLVRSQTYGRNLTRKGEKRLVEVVSGGRLPIWIKHYDRDCTPFYQKPLPSNRDRVANADLIFPSINGGFGGEIVGAGQRQNDVKEIMESLNRQKVGNRKRYKWYVDLRKMQNYKQTSGFGLGIERFLAWILCKESIEDAIIFPRKLDGNLNP